MYLLDTNHGARLLRGDPTIRQRIAELDGAPVATSVVAAGELTYMAFRSDRVAENVAEVRAFLAAIPVHGIDLAMAGTYGELRAAVFRQFGPKERAKQRHTTISQLGFDDNDLWIAAIALQHELIVVSSDSDFARIAEVSPLKHETWLTPAADGN
jgi:tRNA(fMet)-specific endonuclease VapC